jgi:Flp pilus assembly protein CpaB
VEIEYSDKNSRRSKLYIGVGLIVALLVAGTVFVTLQTSTQLLDRDDDLREVVVASRDIPARKAIEEGDVSVRLIVADETNETAFTALDQVIGRVTGGAVASGQLITRNVLASTTEGQTFSILDPTEEFDPDGPDWRAVSLSVEAANAVAGTLVAGQIVDLIVTMAINPDVGLSPDQATDQEGQFVSGPSTKVALQALTILARTGDLYIVRTDVATAEKIAELQALGGVFTMALRPEVDDRLADTDGSTIDRLIEEFGFPVPVPPELEDRSAGN